MDLANKSQILLFNLLLISYKYDYFYVLYITTTMFLLIVAKTACVINHLEYKLYVTK